MVGELLGQTASPSLLMASEDWAMFKDDVAWWLEAHPSVVVGCVRMLQVAMWGTGWGTLALCHKCSCRLPCRVNVRASGVANGRPNYELMKQTYRGGDIMSLILLVQ